MKNSANRCTKVVALLLVLIARLISQTASAAEFQLSLLEDASALENTCQVLKDAGFAEPAISTFRTVVTNHYKMGRVSVSTDFPTRQNGFYQFKGISDLTNRLHSPFGRESSGNPTLMCFDVAALLLSGAGYGAPHLEKEFGSSGIVLPMPGTRARASTYAIFRTAYSLALCSEPDFLRLVGRSRSEEETQLELSLIAPHLLAGETNTETVIRATVANQCQAMERLGFHYMTNVQLGLVSCVDFKGRFISADHAFICIPWKGRLVCIEKTSPKGPYIRADFNSEADLCRYEASTYIDYPLTPGNSGYNCPIVVTVGDRILHIYRSTSALPAK